MYSAHFCHSILVTSQYNKIPKTPIKILPMYKLNTSTTLNSHSSIAISSMNLANFITVLKTRDWWGQWVWDGKTDLWLIHRWISFIRMTSNLGPIGSMKQSYIWVGLVQSEVTHPANENKTLSPFHVCL